MKRSSLRLAGALLAATSLALAGCGNDDGETGGDGSGDETQSYSIGVTQIAAHPSLDASLEGFKTALADAGVEAEYEEENAQGDQTTARSEEHTSELQSRGHLVCRLLLEKKKGNDGRETGTTKSRRAHRRCRSQR